MNCDGDDDWLGGKFRKLIHNNIIRNELYLSCYKIFMVSMIQIAKVTISNNYLILIIIDEF